VGVFFKVIWEKGGNRYCVKFDTALKIDTTEGTNDVVSLQVRRSFYTLVQSLVNHVVERVTLGFVAPMYLY